MVLYNFSNIKYLDYGNIVFCIFLSWFWYYNKQYKTKIKLKDVGENSLTLTYQDKNKKIHKVTIFGYFEGRGKGEIDITIKSIFQDGTLDIQVKQK